MKGAQITCLEQLVWGAQNKRAVICNWWYGGKPKPAAFVANMPALVVARIIANGLWFYVKPLR